MVTVGTPSSSIVEGKCLFLSLISYLYYIFIMKTSVCRELSAHGTVFIALAYILWQYESVEQKEKVHFFFTLHLFLFCIQEFE